MNGRLRREPIVERRSGKRAAVRAETRREEQRRAQRARAQLLRDKVLVNPANLRPTNSYGTPDFVERGYYLDREFDCKACGVAQVWTATQQRWWYESAKGDVWTVAVLCKPCRRREQARKAAARATHLEGLARKTMRPA